MSNKGSNTSIKVKHNHNSLINMIPLFKYSMKATIQAINHIWESRWFESMYTLHGKLDTHGTYAFCASPRTPLVRFLRTVLVRGDLSRVVNGVGHIHYSWEKGTSDYIPSMLTDRSAGPHPVSLPLTTIEAVEKAKHLVTASYIILLGPYH
jgi:hypothetical protein